MSTILHWISLPFGYLMDGLYRITSNYGLAVILFAILITALMYPLNVKNRINGYKKARLEPSVRKIREMFPGDVKIQNQLMEKLYEREKVSISGGCLMSILPIFILIPLFSVVCRPIQYMLHADADTTNKIIEIMKQTSENLFASSGGYNEIVASQNLGLFADALKQAGIAGNLTHSLNYDFLGMNLATIPELDISSWSAVDWDHIGRFMLPILAVCATYVPNIVKKIRRMIYTMKAKKNGQAVPTTKKSKFSFVSAFFMLLFVVACFRVPCALSLYWFTRSLSGAICEIFYEKRLKLIPPMVTNADILANEFHAENPEYLYEKAAKEAEQNAENSERHESASVSGQACESGQSDWAFSSDATPSEKQTTEEEANGDE